ncbi:MAG: rRNA maturation RNase YbeY [Chromatiales bacterium]|jgi:probable rRNA maturation factor
MAVQLDIQRATTLRKLPNDADFQRWAELVLARQHPDGAVVLRIVDEAEIRQLNRDFRDKDAPTNVLSFPYEATDLEKPADADDFTETQDGAVGGEYLGDLVICAPVVESEALRQGKAAQAHWAHMVIHGLLHLLGYDHIYEADAQEMEGLEIKLLAQLGFANPYEIT